MGAFDDNSGKPPQARQRMGLKLTNQNSAFAATPKKPTQAQITQEAKESIQRDQDYKERAAELSIAFKKILDDKCLLTNKSILVADMERELIGKLAQLGVDINNDTDIEEEGMGSIGLINLLFRSLLIQRDKINQLDYKTHELETKLNSLIDKLGGNG